MLVLHSATSLNPSSTAHSASLSGGALVAAVRQEFDQSGRPVAVIVQGRTAFLSGEIGTAANALAQLPLILPH